MVTHEGTFYECVAGGISWIRTQLGETPLQSCGSLCALFAISLLLHGTATLPVNGLLLHLVASLIAKGIKPGRLK